MDDSISKDVIRAISIACSVVCGSYGKNTIQFISVGGIVIHSSFIGTLKLSKAVNMDFISLSIKDASALSTLN